MSRAELLFEELGDQLNMNPDLSQAECAALAVAWVYRDAPAESRQPLIDWLSDLDNSWDKDNLKKALGEG